MKLAASNIAWASDREEHAAGVLRDAGVHGLEVAPTMVWPRPTETSPAALDTYRDRWLDRGVRIVAIQALLFGRPDLILFGDEATRQRMADHLLAMARVAARLGARAMVFGSPGNRRRNELDIDIAMDLAVRFFRSLAGNIAELGTALCIEANPPAYGCDFLTSTAEAARLVRRIDHPGVRLQLDTSTMAVNGEDYAVEIAAGAPIAGHFHASEPHLAALGQGGADHARAAAALRQAGYTGWVSVEMRALPDDSDLDGVAAALQLARGKYGEDD